jgi:hypothetical protein
MKSLRFTLTLVFVLSLFSVAYVSYSNPYYMNISGKDSAGGALYNLAFSSEHISEHINTFSSLGSRVTGYPGSDAAAKYISEYFNKTLGLRVLVQDYPVVIPIDEGSYIEVLSPSYHNFSAHAFWPNYVQSSATSAEGISGKLVYVGEGDLESFDNENVEDSILLMDVNSGYNWLCGINLGAKAVVFVEGEANRYEFSKKFLRNPIYVPRLYVSAEDGSILKSLAKTNAFVKIHSGMRYVNRTAKNIIGVLEGRSPDNIVIISAHYDDWSAVPGKAPGADESSGVASLLELARYYSESPTPPYNTIWFVAFSGHWQGLAGSREFVEEFLFSPYVQQDSIKVWMQINLDLSSDSSQITPLYIGRFYTSGVNVETQARYIWIRNVINGLRSRLPEDAVFWEGLRELRWWGTESEPYMLDSEPAALSGTPAFSLMTSYARRILWGTPLDTPEKVNVGNVMAQLNSSLAIVNEFVNMEVFGANWRDVKPTRLRLYALGGSASYITLKGKVLTFNITTGWYSPVPNALVTVSIRPIGGYHYTFSEVMTFSDANGEFVVHGMPSGQILGYTGPLQPSQRSIVINAWGLSEDTGEITYAPDMGIYGRRFFGVGVQPLTHPFNVTAVVFKCASLEILDLVEPSTGRRGQIPDQTRVGELYYFAGQSFLLPYDFEAFAEPMFFGFYSDPSEPVGVVFVQPGLKTLILYKRGILTSQNVGILANTSREFPEGSGYLLPEAGDRLTVRMSAYNFARDMYSISSARYSVLSKHFVSSLTFDEAMSNAYAYLSSIEQLLKDKTYSKAYTYAFKAWAWSLVAYGIHTMPLIYDLSGTTVFFFLILIPFAFFFERLTLFKEGKSRLIFSVVIGAVAMAFFYVVHPALSIMSNSALSLAGIFVIILTVFVLLIFSREASRIISEEAQRRLGMHRLVTGTLASIELFSSVSVKTMRRHKLRTILTLITLVVSTIGIVSFTSSSTYLGVLVGDKPLEAAYQGILVKQLYGAPPQESLDIYTRTLIMGVVGDRGYVSPRVTLYPQLIYGKLAPTATIKGVNGTYEVNAIMGISHIESERLFGDQGAFLGKSRPFLKEDYYSCILTQTQAKILGVEVGKFIEWDGMRLMVVGIISPEMLKDDLDGRSVAPNSPQTISQYNPQVQLRTPMSIGWDFTVIIPSRLALDLGGYVSSVAVYLEKDVAWAEAESIAKELAKILDAQVYLNWNGYAKSYSRLVLWALLGWEAILSLFVITAANIVVTLMAASRERGKDIKIYSLTGLNPRGGILIVLAESAIYATIAVMFGYLVGITLNLALYQLGILPSIYVLNYSSLAVALTLAGIILVIFIASIYPIITTSKMVAPLLERRWELPTKPKGDEWEIPLPLAFESIEEARGVLGYLYEYFNGEGRETRYFSIVGLQKPSYEGGILELVASLAPRESHITQNVRINLRPTDKKRYGFSVYIKRLTGTYPTWRTSNYNFIDSLRKQLLLWRSLPEEKREEYIKKL